MDNMKMKLITIGTIFIFLTVFFSGCDESNNNSDGNINGSNIEIISLFNCKKVIIRDDDIGASSYLPAVRWIANLALSKDYKITFGVIPTTLVNNLDTIEYLNQLDQNFFEFATHGYKHDQFKGLPYEEQYSLIEMGTNILKENLNYTPYTFIPPYGSSDTNTTNALMNLGYHSITDMRDSPCYVVDFVSDFAYEISWDPTVEHCTFQEFQSSFNTFYDSSDEYFIIFLHDWTFLDENKNLNDTRTELFEEIIDHLKSKNVQFMKIEEAFRRQKDENVIKTGKDQDRYYIDLTECSYNHTIKINPQTSWDQDIFITDSSTGKVTIIDKDSLEFYGIKGHKFYITS